MYFHCNSTGDPLTYANHGRVCDCTANPTPRYYYFPSLMLNTAGDVVLGFSGSKTTEWISAFYTGWNNYGAGLVEPVMIKAGTNYNGSSQWGDYSATTLDPNDGSVVWTVQEYTRSDDVLGPVWATFVQPIHH